MSKFETDVNVRLTSSDRNSLYLYVKASLDMDGTGVWFHVQGLSPMHMSIENYKLLVKRLGKIVDINDPVEDSKDFDEV